MTPWDKTAIFTKNPFKKSFKAFMPAHKLHQPRDWTAGLVFASPHSGNIYPKSFIQSTNLDPKSLRRNEDIFVDRLFMPVIDYGVPFLTAHFPRCFVDLNRAANELPLKWQNTIVSDEPAPITPRAAAGIGVIPTHIHEDLPIYKDEPSREEALARIAHFYTPYHAELDAILNQARAKFGQALLIDCHSMPGFAAMGGRRADIILGDRFGRACHKPTLELIRDLFKQAGFSVALNHPYAGGYITAHYGRPQDNIEAIQIEINRDLYVNPITLKPKSGYQELADKLENISVNLIDCYKSRAIAAQ